MLVLSTPTRSQIMAHSNAEDASLTSGSRAIVLPQVCPLCAPRTTCKSRRAHDRTPPMALTTHRSRGHPNRGTQNGNCAKPIYIATRYVTLTQWSPYSAFLLLYLTTLG